MYNILSLANSTLLIADMILLCIKKYNPYCYCPLHRKMCNCLLGQCCLCPKLTSSTSAKCNVTSYVPSTEYHVYVLVYAVYLRNLSKSEVLCNTFALYGAGSVSPTPTAKLENHPLSAL
jgi:hypothetical protein